MSVPLVSVVMPTYERWPLVAEAVDSVLTQDLGDLELLVVDDGSTDGTAEALTGRDPRVTVLRQPNRGRSAARNTGIAAARAPWLAFLDSDDRWEPHHLSQFSAAAAAAADTDAGWASGVVLWDPGTGGRRPVKAPRWLPADVRAAAPVGMVVSLPGLVLPTTAVRGVGGFAEDLRGSEDWELLVRLTRHLDIHRLPRSSVLVRVHEGRSMTDVDWDLDWRRAATTRLLADPGLGLDDRRVRAVARLVGPATAARWAGRLYAQSLLGGRLSARLRRLVGRG
jgi:glycosyltransferase involved in cell wall biosynthesis